MTEALEILVRVKGEEEDTSLTILNPVPFRFTRLHFQGCEVRPAKKVIA